jgi:hypothetical protein
MMTPEAIDVDRASFAHLRDDYFGVHPEFILAGHSDVNGAINQRSR